jgi:hypothetical protein
MKPHLLLILALCLSSVCRAALIYPESSRENQQAVLDCLGETLHAIPNDFQTNGLWNVIAFRSYFVEPRAVAAGQLLSAVKCGGWRFVILRGSNLMGGTGCIADPTSGKPQPCDGFGTNSYPMAAVAAAERLPELKDQDYEVREFGASLFRGLWLHSKSNDVFIPADGAFGKLEASKPYSEADLIRLLKPYEQKMLPISEASGRQHERNVSMYGDAMMKYEEFQSGASFPISPCYMEIQEESSAITRIILLQGISTNGQKYNFRAKVTFTDRTHLAVSAVEIFERIERNLGDGATSRCPSI